MSVASTVPIGIGHQQEAWHHFVVLMTKDSLSTACVLGVSFVTHYGIRIFQDMFGISKSKVLFPLIPTQVLKNHVR